MSILLIRHGETVGNKSRVIQHPDIPLSERGLAQAARLGRRLSESPIARILSSDFARAQMTAETVQRANGAPLVLTSNLHERNLGALRGTAYADLDLDPFASDYHPPEGESWQQFHGRVDVAWAEVLRHATEVGAARVDIHLAVVTHGLVCHSIVSRLLDGADGSGASSDDAKPLTFGNTSISTLTPLATIEPLSTITPLSGDRWRVAELACVAHLDDGVGDGSDFGGKA